MLTSAQENYKQRLQEITPSLLKMTELCEKLHFQQKFQSGYRSSPVADNPFSPSVLAKKFKRLRLRPSPPTPGERNLRLHWQKNSAFCSSLLKERRKAVSAPPVSRVANKVVGVRNSNLTISLENSSRERLPRRPATSAAERSKDFITDNYIRLNSSRQNSFSPRNQQRINKVLPRSHSFIDYVRPNARISSPNRLPGAPANSPDSGVKDLKVTSQWHDRKIVKSHSDNRPVKTKTKQQEKKLFRLPENADEGKSSAAVDNVAPLNEVKGNSGPMVIPDVSCIKSGNCAASLNMSKQLINVKRTSEVADAKSDMMRIKSLHKRCKPKTKSISSDKKSLKYSAEATASKRSTGSVSAVGSLVVQPGYDNLGIPAVEVRTLGSVLDKEPPPHSKLPNENVSKTSINAPVSQPYLCSKAQLRIKKFYKYDPQKSRMKNTLTEVDQTAGVLSLPEEKHPLAPNPSLVDFGKRSPYSWVDDDLRVSSLYETDQDPAVMLRILSWLENVENSPEFYYGFDSVQ